MDRVRVRLGVTVNARDRVRFRVSVRGAVSLVTVLVLGLV